jgi:type III pantothenate kinase
MCGAFLRAPIYPNLYYGVKIRDYFFESGNAVDQVKTIVLSSVVPAMNDKMKSVSRTLFEIEPIVLGPKVYASLAYANLKPVRDWIGSGSQCSSSLL